MSDSPSNITAAVAYEAIAQFMLQRDQAILKDMQWVKENVAEAEDGSIGDSAAKIMRRNQVLYCVANIAQESFKYADIEKFVRQRFPNTNQGTVLNVTNAMSELANDSSGLLKGTPKRDGYMLKDPMYRKCLQSMLRCADNAEVVEVAKITRN